MDADMNFNQLKSPISDFKIFGAFSYPWRFVITCETRMGEKYKNWTGYTATYQSSISNKPKTNRIEGRWNNFEDAKIACENKLQELK